MTIAEACTRCARRPEQVEARRQLARDVVVECGAEAIHLPRRRHDVDIVEREAPVAEDRVEAICGKLERVLLTVEALFFKDVRRLTALQKSEAGVMRLGDDPEYVHSDPVPFAE